jgi:hypothetical protein
MYCLLGSAPEHPSCQPDRCRWYAWCACDQRTALLPVVSSPCCFLVGLTAVVCKLAPCAAHERLRCTKAVVASQRNLIIVQHGCVRLLGEHVCARLQILSCKQVPAELDAVRLLYVHHATQMSSEIRYRIRVTARSTNEHVVRHRCEVTVTVTGDHLARQHCCKELQ